MNENELERTTDNLEPLLDQLSTDQIRYVVARQEHPSDKDAAEAVGVKPRTVKDWKMRGLPIDAAVRAMASDGLVVAMKLRRRNLGKAMAVKVAGLDEDDPRLRQGVATEIIEWELGRAGQPVDVTSGGEKLGVGLSPEQHARAMATLFDAIGETLPRGDDAGRDAVGAD